MMSIGQVADRAGVTTPTIRYYERIGLINPPERVNGQRRYRDEILSALRLVRMAQEAGFTLGEINTLLNGFSTVTPPGERWQELAQRKIPEVDAMIQRLLSVRQVLEESLACDCLTLDDCVETGWQSQRRSIKDGRPRHYVVP